MKGRISETRERRKLPFLKIGMKVEVRGETGKIVGEDCYQNLMIDFGGKVESRNAKVNIKYFDENGTLIASF